ncbi:MAG: hypothetical protein J6K17_05505 [Oscillospiraceae bacterium]|nr:hypothetical protein [Oscillospiraceae bacterium]
MCNTVDDDFQLMLNTLDMGTQIEEYQGSIADIALKQAEKNFMYVLGNSNALGQFVQSLKSEQGWDISLGEEAKKLLDEGTLKFVPRNDGDGFLPILSGPDNKFAAQVRLHPKDMTPELADGINNYVINKQLAEISKKLDEINETLGKVEAGQRNDRIGLVCSAENIFRQALSVNDSELQRHLMATAIQTANNGRAQLMETMKYDIKYLSEKTAAPLSTIFSSQKTTAETVKNIRTAFMYINEATSICAQGYMAFGEKDAMLQSITEYKDFINSNIIKNKAYEMLQEYDDSISDNNFWIDKPRIVYNELNKLTVNQRENISLLKDEFY